jgi:hypothetical protein
MHLINGPVTTSVISGIIAKGGENQECGAHSLFLGQVRRDQTDGKYVRAIEYSAYEEMVIPEADKIFKLIMSEYDDVKAIEIIHSKGHVKAGDIPSGNGFGRAQGSFKQSLCKSSRAYKGKDSNLEKGDI